MHLRCFFDLTLMFSEIRVQSWVLVVYASVIQYTGGGVRRISSRSYLATYSKFETSLDYMRPCISITRQIKTGGRKIDVLGIVFSPKEVTVICLCVACCSFPWLHTRTSAGCPVRFSIHQQTAAIAVSCAQLSLAKADFPFKTSAFWKHKEYILS